MGGALSAPPLLVEYYIRRVVNCVIILNDEERGESIK